jgi:hypothetical protein
MHPAEGILDLSVLNRQKMLAQLSGNRAPLPIVHPPITLFAAHLANRR